MPEMPLLAGIPADYPGPNPYVTPSNPRQEIIDATHDAAHEAWKIAFPKFVLEFAAKATEAFSGEDVREAYEQTDLPQTEKWQAAGKIYQRLVKERKLHPASRKRSRKYGNWLDTYTKY
jgi:hypothetical protein